MSDDRKDYVLMHKDQWGEVNRDLDTAREQNKILRANVIELVKEKNALLDVIARQSAYILELRRQMGRGPHDYEPVARPGLSEVD